MPLSADRLTIGLPVYNGESSITAAVDSLLAQTQRDFQLIISDNASTDTTESIGRDYAKGDARIRYVRQPTNLGAVDNFAYVLDQANAPYFMWAACDDVWLPEFVERNLAALESQPDYVCSVSRVEFVDSEDAVTLTVGPADRPHTLEGGTFPLEDTPEENLLRFLENPQCNTRFYGVHRTDVIRRCYSPDERYLASDWVVMARTLAFGKHHEIPEVLMRRSIGGASSDVTKLILETNPTWVSRYLLPMLPMTKRILCADDVPTDLRNHAHRRRLRKILWDKNREECRHHWAQLGQRG